MRVCVRERGVQGGGVVCAVYMFVCLCVCAVYIAGHNCDLRCIQRIHTNTHRNVCVFPKECVCVCVCVCEQSGKAEGNMTRGEEARASKRRSERARGIQNKWT